MTDLKSSIQGDVVVVFQLGDLALVESFWGRYVGEAEGLYRFQVTRPKKQYPEPWESYQGPSRVPNTGREIKVDHHRITRVMSSHGSSYTTTWKRNMGLDAEVQAFYDALSGVCDRHCLGYAGVQVEVFFRVEGWKPLYGKISHEILDEGMLDAQARQDDPFRLNTSGLITTSIDNIERIMAYSWPNGSMGGRSEEIGWASLTTSSGGR